jgi:arylsulfatase A-like enzyme
MNSTLSRKQFLKAVGGMTLAAHLAGGRASAQETARPNVVLIIADTLRADVLGSYGCKLPTSPELDALAGQSVQFDCVFAPSSWTLPSIGSLLTSQPPRTLGLFKSTHYLQDRWPTLGEALKGAGYQTFGVTANAMINQVAGFGRGFDQYIDADIDWKSEGRRTRTSDEIFRDALQLAGQKSGAPGYLQINIMETHEYYRGAGKLTRAEFENEFPKAPNTGNRREYLQSVRQVSVDSARFVQELSALPGWENTLFVFLSDHGEGLNDHPAVWQSERHGTLLYESMVRVPMLFHHPGGNLKPARVRQAVSLLDMMPTVLARVNVPAPNNLAGRSLQPLLDGRLQDESLPEFLVAETYSEERDKSAVHSISWQYVLNRDMQAGCNERELQRLGVPANGKKTDEIERWPGAAKAMNTYFTQWNKKYPKGESVRVQDVSGDVGDREEQLKALGYLQ